MMLDNFSPIRVVNEFTLLGSKHLSPQMALRDSQKDMFEHSAKKVELLQLYLDAFLAVIGHDPHTEAIHCHDVFCGEGIYPGGGKGSPIIFAECLRAWAARCPGKKFSFHFNDKDGEKVAHAKKHIDGMAPLPRNLHVTSSTLPFDHVIQETRHKIAELRKEKAFLFVDPYGYKEIKPQLIKDLMKGNKSEVLLFLPTQQMFRFSKKGTPEALSGFLEGLQEGHAFPVGARISEYITFIVQGFRRLMPEYFVDSFTIRKDASTAFCLFFFTSNLKGAEKMLEAKWKLDDQQGAGWSYEAGFSADTLFHEPFIHPLAKLLQNRLHSAPQTNAAIYEATIRAGFLPKHALQILSDMQKNGEIHVKPDGTKAGAFYLNYPATHGANVREHKTITIHLS